MAFPVYRMGMGRVSPKDVFERLQRTEKVSRLASEAGKISADLVLEQEKFDEHLSKVHGEFVSASKA